MTGREALSYFYDRVLGVEGITAEELLDPFWELEGGWFEARAGVMSDALLKGLCVESVDEAVECRRRTGAYPVFELSRHVPSVRFAVHARTWSRDGGEALERHLGGKEWSGEERCAG